MGSRRAKFNYLCGVGGTGGVANAIRAPGLLRDDGGLWLGQLDAQCRAASWTNLSVAIALPPDSCSTDRRVHCSVLESARP